MNDIRSDLHQYCKGLKADLKAEALQQKTYGQAIKYLKKQRIAFDDGYRVTLDNQIDAITNSIIGEVIDDIYAMAMEGDINNADV